MTSDPQGERKPGHTPGNDKPGDHDPGSSWPLGAPPDRREHRHQDLFSTRLIVGLFIILLGGALLADNLGWFDARHVLRSLWPLAMCAVGVAMVRNPQHRRSREGGWVLITVGLWVFADKIGWIHVSLGQLLLPALFLFVGGVMVFRSLSGPPDAASTTKASSTATGGMPPPGDHAEYVRSFALLSGCELRPVSRPFRGADLNAVMGGIKLDLSSARMEGDVAIVEVFAFWGGLEIFVPPDWTVSSGVTTLLAGFIDKRRPTSVVSTKTLIIKGMVVMSGVEIKN